MSSKSTLRHETDKGNQQGFHLYDEVFDEENGYLEVAGLPVQRLNLGRTLRRWCAKFDRKAAPCLGRRNWGLSRCPRTNHLLVSRPANPYKMCINPSILAA
jgi:hypothetical protein